MIMCEGNRLKAKDSRKGGALLDLLLMTGVSLWVLLLIACSAHQIQLTNAQPKVVTPSVEAASAEKTAAPKAAS